MAEIRKFPKGLALGLGVVIGVLWIAMALAALYSSARGYGNGREDWGLGWGLVGVLLLGAGLSALVGSWWHVNRVAGD